MVHLLRTCTTFGENPSEASSTHTGQLTTTRTSISGDPMFSGFYRQHSHAYPPPPTHTLTIENVKKIFMNINRLNLEVILVPQQTEPGGLRVQGLPELQREFIGIPGNLMRFSSQNNNNNKTTQRSWEYKLVVDCLPRVMRFNS